MSDQEESVKRLSLKDSFPDPKSTWDVIFCVGDPHSTERPGLAQEESSDGTSTSNAVYKEYKLNRFPFSQSKYFQALLFDNNEAWDKHTKVSLIDITPNIFEFIKDYFYNKKPVLTIHNVFSVLYFSDKYLIQQLTNQCIEFIRTNWIKDKPSLIEFLGEIAKLDSEAKFSNVIVNKHLRHILSNNHILQRYSCEFYPGFYNDEIVNKLTISVLVELLRSDSFYLNENSIWNLCQRYCGQHRQRPCYICQKHTVPSQLVYCEKCRYYICPSCYDAIEQQHSMDALYSNMCFFYKSEENTENIAASVHATRCCHDCRQEKELSFFEEKYQCPKCEHHVCDKCHQINTKVMNCFLSHSVRPLIPDCNKTIGYEGISFATNQSETLEIEQVAACHQCQGALVTVQATETHCNECKRDCPFLSDSYYCALCEINICINCHVDDSACKYESIYAAIMHKLVPYIKFSEINPTYFQTKVLPVVRQYNLLTDKQIAEAYENMMMKLIVTDQLHSDSRWINGSQTQRFPFACNFLNLEDVQTFDLIDIRDPETQNYRLISVKSINIDSNEIIGRKPNVKATKEYKFKAKEATIAKGGSISDSMLNRMFSAQCGSYVFVRNWLYPNRDSWLLARVMDYVSACELNVQIDYTKEMNVSFAHGASLEAESESLIVCANDENEVRYSAAQ